MAWKYDLMVNSFSRIAWKYDLISYRYDPMAWRYDLMEYEGMTQWYGRMILWYDSVIQ